ncbi:MAG TPA: hypothetical protein EYP23_02685 [Thermoplasmata archaeon]|nr:hypothetical protein [Thermoplasmata archaeon]
MKKTVRYVKQRSKTSFETVTADDDATYEQTYEFDVSSLESQIACPHTVDNVKPVGELAGIHIDQAVFGSCTNGRLEDLAVAADMLKGKSCRSCTIDCYPCLKRNIFAGDETRLYSNFLEADATIINPGCGPCLDGHPCIRGERYRRRTETSKVEWVRLRLRCVLLHQQRLQHLLLKERSWIHGRCSNDNQR